MNILIADDEPLARERLKRLIEEIDSSYKVIAFSTNGLEALETCLQERPDVALLDIRMPLMSGLQVAAELMSVNANTHVIFVTAFNEYALDAFDKNAIDYLLKPIKKDRLAHALAKVSRMNQSMDNPQTITSLIGPRQHLCAHTHHGLKIMKTDDIIYFRAEHKYVQAVSPHESVLLDDSLKALEKEFHTTFIRIHRNALVNINAISSVQKSSSGELHLHLLGTDTTLIISRRHHAKLNKHLRQRIA